MFKIILYTEGMQDGLLVKYGFKAFIKLDI